MRLFKRFFIVLFVLSFFAVFLFKPMESYANQDVAKTEDISGWYIIKANANKDVSVNIKEDYADSYTRAGMLDTGDARAQKFYISKNNDGTYSILTGSSNKAGALSAYKNQIWQVDYTGEQTQKWEIEYNADGSVSFINKSDGRAMDIPYGKAVSGAEVNVYTRNTSKGQKFVLAATTEPSSTGLKHRDVKDGWYIIKANANKDVSVNIKEDYADSYTRAGMLDTGDARAQKFYISKNNDGTYSILTGSSNKAGALSAYKNQIWQVDYTGEQTQKWEIEYNADGSVSFINKSDGRAMDIPYGKAVSGAEVNVYTRNTSKGQKFVLAATTEPSSTGLKHRDVKDGWYIIKANANKDVSVNIKEDYADSYTRAGMLDTGDARAQKFYISKNNDGTYSILTGSSNKAGALSAYKNQIWQVDYTGEQTQKWEIEYNADGSVSFINKSDGRAMDIPYGKAVSGAEVNVYTRNTSKGQKFVLAATTEPSSTGLKHRDVKDGWYIIKANANKDVSVNIKEDYADSYTRAGMLDTGDARAQKFYISKNNDGTYSILTGSSNKAGALSAYKNQIWQVDYTGEQTQKWEIEYNADGSVSFINKSDGRAMDIPYGKAVSGAEVNVYTRNTSKGQKFVLAATTEPSSTGLKHRDVKDGWYIIKANANKDVSVNIKEDYADSYTRAGMLDTGDARAQKFYISKNNDGTYSILTGSSNKAGALSAYKNQIWQVDYTGEQTQKWEIEYNADGSVSFINKSDGRAMDIPYGKAVSGAEVNVYTRNTSKGQKFVLAATTEPSSTGLKHRDVKDGWYIIKANANKDVSVNIKEDYADSYTRAGMLDTGDARAQKFYISKNNDGTYSILTGSSNKAGALSAYKNQIWQVDYTGEQTQKWEIEYNADGSVSFINKSDGRAMDIPYGKAVSGAEVNVYTRNTSKGQKFVLAATTEPSSTGLKHRDVKDGWYIISPKGNADVSLNVRDDYANDHTRVRLQNSVGNRQQSFFVSKNDDGSYSFLTGSSGKKAALTSYNNQIWQEDYTGKSTQKWAIEYNTDGSVSFINKSDERAIDIPYGKSTPGAEVNVYTRNTSNGQKFALTAVAAPDISNLKYRNTEEGWYTISPAKDSKVSFDIQGGYKENYTRLQIYTSNNNKEQKFYLQKNSDGSYAFLTGASDGVRALTEYNNQIWQVDYTGAENQKWKIEYNGDNDSMWFINCDSGLAMDIPNAVVDSGTYIGTYEKNSNVGQNMILTPTEAPRPYNTPDYESMLNRTEDPVRYGAALINGKYYINDTLLTGLQKIGDRWFLFDEDGSYTGESSDKIKVASFFQSDEKQDTRMYITLNGRNFHHIKSSSNTMGRDMNIYAKNGIFYILKTFYEDGDEHYQFAIHQTEDFKRYRFVPVAGLQNKTDHFANWAPEWFVDDDGTEYVFYASEQSETDNGYRKFGICMTKANDVAAYDFAQAKECIFNNRDERTGSFIDPYVIKKDGIYYMIVKENTHKGILYDGMLMYKSSNLIDWEYVDRVRDALPRNLEDNFEGLDITYINGLYYLYADQYFSKESTGDYEYDNKIHYAVSEDMTNWQYMGTVDMENYPARHGSVSEVRDALSEQRIQSLYNGEL